MGERKSLWRRLPALLDRTEILHILEEHNEEASRKLAVRKDATPEALYYLAAKGSPEVRRAVAANPAAPFALPRRSWLAPARLRPGCR